jgi:hypothetical protein
MQQPVPIAHEARAACLWEVLMTENAMPTNTVHQSEPTDSEQAVPQASQDQAEFVGFGIAADPSTIVDYRRRSGKEATLWTVRNGRAHPVLRPKMRQAKESKAVFSSAKMNRPITSMQLCTDAAWSERRGSGQHRVFPRKGNHHVYAALFAGSGSPC